MHLSRRGVIAASLAAAVPARAQAPWPGDRPMRILLPARAGGTTDSAVRAMLPFLAAKLGGARIAVESIQPAEDGYVAMAGAAADGLTLGLLVSPQVQALTIGRTARFDLRRFAWIGTVFEDPSGFFVAPDSPIRTLADLLQAARSAPDGVLAGTTGIVVRVDEQRWLRLAPVAAADALELGYHAGNLHWRVRFEGAHLLVALEGPASAVTARLKPMIDAGRVEILGEEA